MASLLLFTPHVTKCCIAIPIFFFTTRSLPLVLYVQINLRVYALNLTFQHALRATELPFLVLCLCRSSWISFIVIQRRIQNFQDHLYSYLYQEKFVTKSTPCTLSKKYMTGIWDWQNTTMISKTSSQYISRFSLLVAEYTRQLRQRPQLYDSHLRKRNAQTYSRVGVVALRRSRTKLPQHVRLYGIAASEYRSLQE